MSLVIVCLSPLNSSLLVNLGRLNPSAGKVVLHAKSDAFTNRLPRHIELVEGDVDLWKIVKDVSGSSVLVILRDSLLMVPDALPTVASVATALPGKYVSFVDSTTKTESIGVVHAANRHWSISPSVSKTFACRADTFKDDMDLLKEIWNAPTSVFWASLESILNRRCLCPIPSFAAPLPLSDTTNPPSVGWAQLQEFMNRA